MELEMSDELEDDYTRLSKLSMTHLLDILRGTLNLNTWFTIPFDSKIIPFHMDSCNVKGALRCSGYLCNSSDLDDRNRLPLITFTVCLAPYAITMI